MLNQKVLMSSADFFALDAKINPYYFDNQSVDVTRAQLDHENVARCFREAGMEIINVPAPQSSQDGVYVANWALCHDGKAVLARLPNARKTEEKHAAKILQELGYEVIEVPEDWHFSGQGDALKVGKFLIAGNGYRSDARANEFVAKTLGLELVQVRAKPEMKNGRPVINAVSGWSDSFFYDIDLAVAILRDDLIAYCPDALDEESVRKLQQLPLKKIKVDYDEAINGLACNLVSTGQTVIMSSRAPKLRDDIEKYGLQVLTPEVEELTRGGGFIRCVSLWLD
jgi:N-dimethylarginine dimethylaminohydrolase